MSEGLPSAFGTAVASFRIRTAPEDFLVEEIDAFEPTGEGEHLLLTIEKRGLNTVAVAKRLAAWAGLPEMAIGYAGMKDRHAVTRQRFSVHLPKRVAPDTATLHVDDAGSGAGQHLRVLNSSWHNRKLPRGALAGNRFVLLLRDVQGDRGAINARLAQIGARGLPNWFGEQRFGREGGNVASALSMFAGNRVRRDQRSILLSAARSELFNRVLATRVRDASWDRGLDGEVWVLSGSRSVFGPEPWNDELAARLARFDIHPSGPLWGAGELRSTGSCAETELVALQREDAIALRAGLETAGLKQERRALRLVAEGLAWEWQVQEHADHVLRLEFALPPGCYATALLHELGPATDGSQQHCRSSERALGQSPGSPAGV
ncbi:MAG: tRNA pseudouridine(13) synthase TruD [Pseudoxanthomonas sp.]